MCLLLFSIFCYFLLVYFVAIYGLPTQRTFWHVQETHRSINDCCIPLEECPAIVRGWLNVTVTGTRNNSNHGLVTVHRCLSCCPLILSSLVLATHLLAVLAVQSHTMPHWSFPLLVQLVVRCAWDGPSPDWDQSMRLRLRTLERKTFLKVSVCSAQVYGN